jgi:nitroreductase
MNKRVAQYPVLPLILDRWSTRAFDPSAEVQAEELSALFEASRWAPSAFNVQPWRFVYALRGRKGWASMLDLLIPFNRSWAASAGALVFACSETDVADKVTGARVPSYSHSFDAGAAWAMFALQAHSMGLSTHAMTGFDAEAAQRVLRLPSNVRPEAVVAVGRPGSPSSLPSGLRERDVPSDRRKIGSFCFEATFSTAEELDRPT